ncbi:MAG: hypothetical protein ABI480_11270 [Chitinophagaceae bacterium]
MPWLICGAGLIFCLSGVFLLFKEMYEKGSSIKGPVVIILMGILLIASGTAQFFKLFP